MQKRSLINRIYDDLHKSRVTSHIYSDNDWRNLRNVASEIIHTLSVIKENGKGTYVFDYGETRYEGVIGELGHCKVYEFTITDADADKEIIHGKMICSFCGPMSDPMGAYDVTVLMN